MNNRKASIDLANLGLFLLKRIWLPIICAAIGFTVMYQRANRGTYTMYIYNNNPNLINFGYANASDLNSAVMLVDTYAQVVRSNRVLDAIAERMSANYPGIQPGVIGASLSMASVNQTGVVQVSSRTPNGQLSADIVNAVLDVAPNEIKRVVGAGAVEIIDYATAPVFPDARNVFRQGMIGALAGAVAAGALLVLIFLLNRKVGDPKELTENYTLSILSTIRRRRGNGKDPGKFILNEQSEMDLVESYAKLRMNLLYTLVGKERKSIIVTSAVSGEGKSTIAANLAISLAAAGKKILLVDADMRRACQHDVFVYPAETPGLSDILAGQVKWRDTILANRIISEHLSVLNPDKEKRMEGPEQRTLDILPAGTVPPNPSELLESSEMRRLLEKLENQYDLILLDAPPVNIVSDPLALASQVAGGIFVVRQNFSDHREIRKALIAAEMTGLELLGFVFYGEKLKQGSYYSRKHYGGYHSYDKYDPRRQRKPIPKSN